MKQFKRILSLIGIVVTTVVLAACAKTVENEHLPEYCRTYSGFMATASPDLYNKIGDINQFNYLSVISEIEIDWTEDDPTREFDLNGIQCFQNLTSLTLRGASFKDISQISALKNIQSITLEDTSVVSISSFKNLSKVNYLSITGSYSLQSVDGVEEMTKLTFLDLSDNGIVDIDELNSLVNLEVLILDNNQISFFPNINQLEHLTTLSVVNNGIEELGDDLSGLSNLIVFNAAHNNIKDLSSLDDLTSIRELILNDNDLGFYGTTPDFSALLNAPNLEILNLENNNLTSISDLQGKDLPLDKLYLSGNLLTDITPISGFTELRVLELSNNQISDIDDLSGMENLISINLDNNLLTDFSGLLAIEGLQVVNLHDNEITFIPPIADAWPNLISLDLRNNVITDTSGVEGHPTLYELDLRNNGLTRLDGISNLPNLSILTIDQDPEELDENGDAITELTPNAIRVINNSFNNTSIPLVDTLDNYQLMLPFILFENAEIYGSFNDIYNMQVVDLRSMEIDVIDEFSFNNDDTYAIYVNDNNLEDISFLLNNPSVREINISENPINSLSVLSGTSTTDFDNLTTINASGIPAQNSLNGAFVDLPELISLNVQNTEFSSIVNSFNGLNNLSTLTISSTTITEIIGSFNDLQPASAPYSITLSSGNLGYISNSFNNGVFQVIGILNQTPDQVVTIIEDSFNDLEVTSNGGLVITDSSFQQIDNSFNRSQFVQLGIESSQVETITNSFNQTSINSTLSLDGNNLTTMDLSGLTTVQSLHLSGNTLTDISFLETMSTIEDLILDVDLVDLSVLEVAQFRTTLESFVFTNFQVIPDLSIFSDYDSVTTFTLNTPNTIIDQLDGMDALETMIFNNPEIITTISNSFNNMPSMLLQDTDLEKYDVLSLITNSFDMYDSSFTGELIIPVDINIVDSFDLLETVLIEANSLDTSPSFDTLSFDSIVSMKIDNPNYNSYAFLNDHPTVETLILRLVQNNVSGIVNDNITTFSVQSDITDSISADINDLGMLLAITSAPTLTISSDNENFMIFNSSDVVINTTNTIIDAFVRGSTVTVNGPALNTISYSTGVTNVLNVNAPLLTSITDGDLQEQPAGFVNLITNQPLLSTSISAANLNIYNDSLTSITTLSNVSDVEIFSTSPSISVTPDIDTLTMNNNALIDLTIQNGGPLSSLFVSSNGLTDITVVNNTIDEIYTSTNQSTLSVVSPTTQFLDITAINVNDLNVSLPSGDVVLSNNVANLVVSGSVASLNVDNTLIQLFTLENGSSVNGTITLDSNGLNTVITNDASINEVNITSNVSVLNVNGTQIGAAIINDSSLATLNMTAINTNVSVTSTNTSLTLNTDIRDITISNPLLQTINITTNGMDDLDLQNARQVNVISATGTIGTVINRSETASLNIAGPGIGLLNIIADNMTTLTANVGSGNVEFTSTNTGILSFDVSASRMDMSSQASTTTFSNSSVIGTLDMGNSVVENMIFGNADVETLLFENTTTGTLSISGNNMNAIEMSGGFGTLNLTTNATSLDITANTLGAVINTNTASLNVSSANTIDINSTNSALTDLELNVAGANIYNSDVNLLIGGSATNLLIDSNSLNNLTFDLGFTNTTLSLQNVNITALNTTNTSVLGISSDVMTSFTINESSITEFIYEGANISLIDATLNNADTIVNTTNTNLDVDGSMLTLTIAGDFITALDLNDLSTNQIELFTNSLSVINTGTTLTDFDLIVQSGLQNLDITTLSNDITLQGNTALHATLHSTHTGNVDITAEADEFTFDMASATVSLVAANVSQVNGFVSSLSISGNNAPTNITLDITANTVDISNNQYESIFMVGTNTVDNVVISSDNVSLIATNNNTITNLSVGNTTPTVTIDSRATVINHTGVTELNVTVYDSTTVNTNAKDVSATSTSLGTLDISMNGTDLIKTFSMNNVNTATINTGAFTQDIEVRVTGLNNSWSLDGNALDSLNIVDVTMTDFEEVINTFDTISDLTINLLDTADLAIIITSLEGTAITLESPLLETQIFDYYYAIEYAALDNQTEKDARFSLIETDYINDAYTTMNANLYFQHWDESVLKGHIGNSEGSSYLTVQEYFDSYANFLGFVDEAAMLADEGYTQVDIDNIKTSIQSVLNDPLLVIPGSVTIDNEVQSSIETDATLQATVSFTNRGFSVVELS